MGKHIIGENGISYTKGTDGIYYPDLKLPEGEDYEIGRYGVTKREYCLNKYLLKIFLFRLINIRLTVISFPLSVHS